MAAALVACAPAIATFAQDASPEVVAATAPYEGELPALIDRALLFDTPETSGGQLSPDGEYVTLMRPYEGERNVYIKRRDEPLDAARPLTTDERPVPGYFWSRDSKYVLYVQDAAGDENYHVYAVDPAEAFAEGGAVPEPRALTEGEGVRAEIVAVPRSKPDKIYIGLNDRDPAYHDLYEVDIATGEKTLLRENTDQVSSYVFDHDGELHLVTKTAADGGTEIYAVGDDDSLSLSLAYACSVDETCYPAGVHPDGERVWLVSNKGDESDLTALLTLDPATGATEYVEADPEGEVDFGGAITSDLTHELLGTVYVGDKPRYYWRDEEYAADFEFLREQLPGREDVSFGSSTADERVYLVSASSDTEPSATYVFDRDADELDLLYETRPDVPTEALADMQPISYPSTDGLEIPAYLTLPEGVEPENLPVVLFVHGGPWSRDDWGYHPYAQFLANRGYAVLQPNFRGSTGYGKAFLNAGNGEWGRKMQDDVTAGAKYLIDEGIADPERIGIMGGSYGGYAVLAGLAFTPDVYAAGVDIVGPSNLETLLASIPPYWDAFRKQMYRRMAEPGTADGDAWLAERSPLNSATDIDDPLLVVQGANDPRVKQAESDQIVVALRDLDREIEYIVAEDEGHGFRRPENNMAMLAATERFFAEHLGGRYQADMPDDVAARLAEITVDPGDVVLAQAPSEAELGAPRPEPARELTPGESTYALTIDMMGQQMKADITETITATDSGYVVVQTMSSPMLGEATDEVLVAKGTLMPMSRTAKQGPATIEMTYPASGVAGTMSMQGNEVPIAVDLDGPIFTDGAAEAATIAALPLAEGYTTVLRRVDAQTQQPKLERLTVTGIETVEVPAGTAEAYRVEVKPADGSAGEGIYYVETAAPHRVLKITAVVPAMNGATMEQVLVE